MEEKKWVLGIFGVSFVICSRARGSRAKTLYINEIVTLSVFSSSADSYVPRVARSGRCLLMRFYGVLLQETQFYYLLLLLLSLKKTKNYLK